MAKRVIGAINAAPMRGGRTVVFAADDRVTADIENGATIPKMQVVLRIHIAGHAGFAVQAIYDEARADADVWAATGGALDRATPGALPILS
jgi:hypothetical protein